jgi:hypothetical protein
MDDKVRIGRRCVPRNLCVGPPVLAVLGIVVAVFFELDPTPGIAKNDDTLDIVARQREWLAIKKHCLSVRSRDLACTHGKYGCFLVHASAEEWAGLGALLHGKLPAVGDKGRAGGTIGNYSDTSVTFWPDEFDPRGDRRALSWLGEKSGQES